MAMGRAVVEVLEVANKVEYNMQLLCFPTYMKAYTIQTELLQRIKKGFCCDPLHDTVALDNLLLLLNIIQNHIRFWYASTYETWNPGALWGIVYEIENDIKSVLND